MGKISLYEIGESVLELPAGVESPPVELGVIEASRNLYASRGYLRPWVCYLAVLGSKCVGTCDFTGPPSQGAVEIAYFTFPGREGRGVATKMAELLVDIALKFNFEGLQVIAHTLPVHNASTSILAKVGFKFFGEVLHEEDGMVWKWVRA